MTNPIRSGHGQIVLSPGVRSNRPESGIVMTTSAGFVQTNPGGPVNGYGLRVLGRTFTDENCEVCENPYSPGRQRLVMEWQPEFSVVYCARCQGELSCQNSQDGERMNIPQGRLQVANSEEGLLGAAWTYTPRR
jgi:hypothetical protein